MLMEMMAATSTVSRAVAAMMCVVYRRVGDLEELAPDFRWTFSRCLL